MAGSRIDTGARVALVVIVLAEIPGIWSQALPSPYELGTGTGHSGRWLRRGEVQAAGLSVAMGAGVSALVRSPWPVLGSVAVCAYLWWMYESALKDCKEGQTA
jgi:hypothetical protein